MARLLLYNRTFVAHSHALHTYHTAWKGQRWGERSLQDVTHDFTRIFLQDVYREDGSMRLNETIDSPKHSPGVALLCDVGVGCEYRFGGGGAGGPGGG